MLTFDKMWFQRQGEEGEGEQRRNLMEGAASPVDLTSLGVTLTLRNETNAEHVRHIPFSVAIRGWNAVENRAQFAIAVLVRDERGNIVGSHGENVTGRIMSEGVRQTITYTGAFDAPVGQRTFGRVIVLDKSTRELGTIRFRSVDGTKP